MSKYKIFPTCFPYNTRIAAVITDIFTNSLPHTVKYTCRTCKMYPGEILMFETNLSNCGPVYIYKINYTIGQACFSQNPHNHISAVYLGICRFPHHYIPAHGCGSWEI